MIALLWNRIRAPFVWAWWGLVAVWRHAEMLAWRALVAVWRRTAMRVWRRLIALWHWMVDWAAFLREETLGAAHAWWANARAWLLDVTGANKRATSWGGARTLLWAVAILALALALLPVYTAARAILRHSRAFRFHYDMAALWWGLLVFELTWVMQAVISLIWPSAALRIGILGAILTSAAWVAWTNGALLYEDDLLQHERSLRSVIDSILHWRWWDEL